MLGGGSGVYQSDPMCLTCRKHLGNSGKWSALPKMKFLPSQTKIKSIYTSGKISEVSMLETVPPGGVVRQAGEAVVWLMAHVCSVTLVSDPVCHWHLSHTAFSGCTWSASVYSTRCAGAGETLFHWCTGTPACKREEMLLHYTSRNFPLA